MDKQTIIQLSDVNFSYDSIPVLEGVDLIIKQNDFLGIIGPNGGGKTTLLKLILGLITPDRGEIKIFDKPPKENRHYIGYVPQLFNFDFDFPVNVFDIVLMGRLGKKRLGRSFLKEDFEISLRALNKIGMGDFQNHEIGKLSGGQRQRVFIARALAAQPKILLLDEPVASIDSKWQTNFFEFLAELNKEIAIVLVTHDVSVVSTYIDQIACVNRKIHFHGKTKEGIHQISEMYHCPVDLVAHSVPHRSLHGHGD